MWHKSPYCHYYGSTVSTASSVQYFSFLLANLNLITFNGLSYTMIFFHGNLKFKWIIKAIFDVIVYFKSLLQSLHFLFWSKSELAAIAGHNLTSKSVVKIYFKRLLIWTHQYLSKYNIKLHVFSSILILFLPIGNLK